MKTPSEIKHMRDHLLQRHGQVPDRIERITAYECAKLLNWVLEEQASDPIVSANIEKIILRSRAGMEEYGTTLADNNGDAHYWLNHLQEELLDAANYIEVLKNKVA